MYLTVSTAIARGGPNWVFEGGVHCIRDSFARACIYIHTNADICRHKTQHKVTNHPPLMHTYTYTHALPHPHPHHQPPLPTHCVEFPNMWYGLGTKNSDDCRAVSVSEQSKANDRGLFELPLYLQYIYTYILSTALMSRLELLRHSFPRCQSLYYFFIYFRLVEYITTWTVYICPSVRHIAQGHIEQVFCSYGG